MDVNLQSVCLAALSVAFCCFAARPASAAVTVFGTGMAHTCYQAARHLPEGQPANPQLIDACTRAINYEDLSVHDLAGTHINRGVLLISRSDYAAARQDFDIAADLMPELGEAYTDRGAALVGLRQYAEAIVEINRGLALNTTEPEKAYFNRALANEALDDLKAAYYDYSRAAQLNPNWSQPRDELTRFTVAAAGHH
jgi:tetratricopeptide (TPR) repeat protein